MKEYVIKKTRTFGREQRDDSITYWKGTLPELITAFSYALEIGNSWNRKIQRQPKSIKSFVLNLQKSYDEQEAACYNRTYVDGPIAIIPEGSKIEQL